MIPFAAYTTGDSKCISVGRTTLQNCTFPRDLDPI